MIPKEIEEVFWRFEEAGSEVYLVGGCVRDFLLGKEAKDYDLTTPLEPDEILDLFDDHTCYTIGKKFGTIGILTSIGTIEITTFRIDGEYIDNRKPKRVTYTKSLKEDLARRDFTINAMAYNPKCGLVDPFSGQEDLKKMQISTVGDPDQRFQEDGLRILRAIRFMGQLGFDISPKVQKSIKKNSHLIKRLSVERVRDEMEKILLLEKPSFCLYKLVELGVMEKIFPSIMDTVDFDQRSPYHDKTLFDHIACVVDNTPRKLSLRLAALFHDIEKPSTLTIDSETGKGHFYGHDILGSERAVEILSKLHEPKILVKEVSLLIREHMKVHDYMTDKALRRQIHRVGEDLILDLYDLMAADMACTYDARSVQWILDRKDRIQSLLEQGVVKKDQLAVSGKDLLDLGLEEGPEIGRILKELQEMVVEDPSLNRRNELLTYLKNKLKAK